MSHTGIITSDINADGLKYVKCNYVIRDKALQILDGDQTKLRWVIPKGARWQLCLKTHDKIGNFGVDKTLYRIRKTYWFPKRRHVLSVPTQ